MTRTLFASAFSVALLGGVAWADTVISTLDLFNSEQVFQPFGDPVTPFYGQSLTIPVGGGSLISYEIVIQPLSGTSLFRSWVFAWDEANSRMTGTALYQSGQRSLTAPDGFFTVLFEIPGGLELTAGQRILLMFDAYTDRDASANEAAFGFVAQASYTDGRAVILPLGVEPFNPVGQTWLDVGSDFVFRATFANVPEAGTWGAGVVGMMGVGAWMLRARRAGK